MDKNTITGLILIAIVFIGFTWWSQPSAEEVKAQQEQVAKQEAAKKQMDKAKAAAIQAQKAKVIQQTIEDTTALFHKALQGVPQHIVLKNSQIELTLNSKGATVEKAFIKNYKDNINERQGVVLFDQKDQSLNYTLAAKEANISTQDLYFEPSQVTDSTVVFTAWAGQDKSIVLSYRLGSDYMLHMLSLIHI